MLFKWPFMDSFLHFVTLLLQEFYNTTIPTSTAIPEPPRPIIENNNIDLHPGWKYIWPYNYACGWSGADSRIINGHEASLGQFPWMARIGYKKRTGIKFLCGGSLIGDSYVVTAAHCLKGQEGHVAVVRFGEHIDSLDIDCEGDICAPPVQDIPPEDFISHNLYPLDSRYDIAVIKLSHPVTLNDFVRPICLPNDTFIKTQHDNETVTGTVAGWGIIDSSTEDTADKLMYVDLPVIGRNVCDTIYAPMQLDGSQLCVGVDTGEDSCTGDSGGPLMVRGYSHKQFLLGVVSFGKAYCGENPSVYTNVTSYMPWILDSIAELSGESQSEAETTTTDASFENINMLIDEVDTFETIEYANQL